MKKIFNLLLIFILMIIGLGFNSNFEYVEADAGQYNKTRILENIIDNGGFETTISPWYAIVAQNDLTWDSNEYAASTANNNSTYITMGVGGLVYEDGHSYYITADIYSDLTSEKIKISNSTYGAGQMLYEDAVIGWETYTDIFDSAFTSNSFKIYIFDFNLFILGDVGYFNNIMMIDLTDSFGAGNEPSLAEFEIILADAPDYFETWSYNYYEADPYISDFVCERTMKNVIENGDFSVDSNSDGLADDWNQYGVSTYYFNNNYQNLQNNIDNSHGIQNDVGLNYSADDYDILYISIDAWNYGNNTNNNVFIFGVRAYNSGGSAISNETSSSIILTLNQINYSQLLTIEQDEKIAYIRGWMYRYLDVGTTSSYNIDNFMIFNLTAEWGAGNEPSLAEFEDILDENMVGDYTDWLTFDDTCWMTVEQNNPIYQYNENIEIYDGQLNMVWTETILHDPLVNPSTDIYYIIEKYDLEMNYLGLIHDGKFGEWQSNADGYFYHDIDYTLPDPLLTEEGYIYVVYDSMGAGRKIYGAGYIFREPSTQFLTAYNDGTNDVRTLYDAIGVNNSPYLDIVSSYQFENNYDDYLFNENNPLLLTHIRINVTDYSTSDVVYYSENTTQEITLGIPFMYEKYCDLTMSRDWWNPLNTYECVYYLSEDDTLPYLFEYLNNNIIYTAYLVGVVDDYEINFLNVFDSVNYADNEGVYTYNILENDVNKKAIGETPFYHINYFHEMSIVNHQIRSGRNLYLDIHKYNNYIDTVFTYQYLYDNNTSVYEYDINNNEDQSFIMEVFEGLSSDDATIYYHLQNTDGVFKNGAVEDAYDVYVSDDYFMTFATSFPDKVDDWMDDLGMNSIIGKIIVSISLLILVTIFVFIYSKNIIIVLFVDFIIIALLAILGIIPLWIILVGIMLIFGGLFIKNRGRE